MDTITVYQVNITNKNRSMLKKSTDEPVCVLDYAFRRIGGKYKGRILWYIHKRDGVSYNFV